MTAGKAVVSTREGCAKVLQPCAVNASRRIIQEKRGFDTEGDNDVEVLKNAAKQKAEEKIKEEMGDKLKGFFNR